MQHTAVVGVKVVVAFILAVSLAGQVFVIPFLADELVRQYPEFEGLRVPGDRRVRRARGVRAGRAGVRVAAAVDGRGCEHLHPPTAFSWVNALIGCCVAFAGLIAVAFVILYAASAMQGGIMQCCSPRSSRASGSLCSWS